MPRSKPPRFSSFHATRRFGSAPCASSFLTRSRLSKLPFGIRGAPLKRPARPAEPGERVQRRPTCVGRVRIGTMIQQQRRRIEVSINDREDYRRRAVGGLVGRAPSGSEQCANRLDVAVAMRKQQRSKAGFGSDRRIRRPRRSAPESSRHVLQMPPTSAPSGRASSQRRRLPRRARAGCGQPPRHRCAQRSSAAFRQPAAPGSDSRPLSAAVR